MGPFTDANTEKLPFINTSAEKNFDNMLLNDGDIIIADTAEDETVGKSTEIINIGSRKIVSGLHTIACRPKIKMTQTYLGFYLNSETYHSQLYSLMQGIKVLSISKSNIETTIIKYPCLHEQKKICSLLCLIEKRISKQQQLIEHLKKYKRGLLKAVFSREVQFETCSNWERRLFSEIATLSKEKYSPKQEEKFPCIELEHLEQQTGHILGYINSKEQNSIKSMFHKGDVLFGKLRPYLRKFAHPDFDGVCSSEIWVFQPSEEIDSSFLFYLIQSEDFIAAANISSGTKMPRAEWSKVSNESYFIPNISVQKKISNTFEYLDKRIVNASTSLNNLQILKQGLLQQLFI